MPFEISFAMENRERFLANCLFQYGISAAVIGRFSRISKTSLSHSSLGVPTLTVTALDVLLLKLVSPRYVAVIELAAIGSVVVKVAVPAESVPVPIEVPLLRNSTVPVGVPAPGLAAVTVAVKVTGWVALGVVLEIVSVVVDDAWPTVTEPVEVWPEKSVLPE